MATRDAASPAGTPRARMAAGIGSTWDVYDTANLESPTMALSFGMGAAPAGRVSLDPEVYAGIEVEARAGGTSPEALINRLLAEHLQQRRIG
ncbi:MAG: hypothetical protein HY321_02125 [Armatimonadetes bacterium]|nr:hypothetical protein [Armatimonadota bacterium]